MLPEFFGAMPRESEVGGQFGNPSMTLPGGCLGDSEKGSKDVFAKSEKWLRYLSGLLVRSVRVRRVPHAVVSLGLASKFGLCG